MKEIREGAMMSRILQICLLMVCCCAVSSLMTWQFAARYFDKYYTNLIIELRSKQLFPVVYCRKTIPANTVITPEYLEFRRVPEMILPANAMDSFSDVLGRKANCKIEKGYPVNICAFDDLKKNLPQFKQESNSAK